MGTRQFDRILLTLLFKAMPILTEGNTLEKNTQSVPIMNRDRKQYEILSRRTTAPDALGFCHIEPNV